MSISSIINRNNYIGNDSTALYPYSFKVYTKNDFEIKVRNSTSGSETLLVVDVDYTVSGAGTVSGGNITLIGAGAWLVASKLTSGYELSIRRLREIKQLADIKNQGSFYPETHEDVFDKMTMIDLQQQDSIDRSVKLPSSINPNSFNTDIPASIVGSVNRAFITNATGDGFDVGPTADEISNAQGYALAADASADAAALSEAAALASETAAGVSEVNAAASAASAAATLASALWRDVVFLTSASSPVAILQADNGKLFVCDTSGGAIVINLPAVSTLTLPFTLGVKLELGSNSITINRGGSDTIGGATSKILLSAGSGTQLIADDTPSPDVWTSAEFGAASFNFTSDTFSGNGSQTAFTLSIDPGTVNNTQVYVDGIYQFKSTYSLSTTTLTFSTAPPTGTNNIQVNSGGTIAAGIPSDGSVSTVKIADGGVTAAKIASATITNDKLAALGQQISSSSGSFTTTSATEVDVTNLTVTITTLGRPVKLELTSDSIGSGGYIGLSASASTNNISGSLKFLKGSTTLSSQQMNFKINTATTSWWNFSTPSAFSRVDTTVVGTPGTYTYKVQVIAGTNTTVAVESVKLVAYEL